MSTDLRALMQDLADSVPYTGEDLALADRSYVAGRRRRRVRHLEISSAAAVVVLMALLGSLFVGSSPLAAEYGTSGGTTVHGYPKHIGDQWQVLDLPAKPGPLAAVVQTNTGWDAVSATGHRWHLPQAIAWSAPRLSADGRLLAYMPQGVNGVGDGWGRYTVLDVVAGTRSVFSQLADGFGCDCHGGTTALHQVPVGGTAAISTDDRYVVLDEYILDVALGRVLADLPAQGFGWSGDRILAFPQDAASKRVDYYDLHGSLVNSRTLSSSAGGVVSPDGNGTAALDSGPDGLYRLNRVDLQTGRTTSQPVTVQAVNRPALATSGGQAALLTTSRSNGDSYDQVTAIALDGTSRTLIRLSGSVAIRPVNGNGMAIAANVLAGPARTPLLLDRITAFTIAHLNVSAWYVGSIVALVLIVRTRVGSRLRSAFRSSGNVTRRWHRRWGLTLLIPLVGLAVVTPQLILPLGTGDLSSAVAPVWWPPDSPTRPSFPETGLYPVSLVLGRHGEQQGFAVRVSNTTSRAQTLLTKPSANGAFSGRLTMSTRDGARDEALSLTYGPVGTIPAHQSRWVKELWVTGFCSSEGGSITAASLPLRVRIGWVTRTERIGLFPNMGLTGPDPSC